jgi:lactoylglutathione lyase
VQLNYAIVFVSDMQASISFYRDVFGLPLRFESPHWTEFATDSATLALHLSDGTGQVVDDERSESPGSCRPGLRVPDLDAFHERMLNLNVQCRQPPTKSFGTRIATYVDPDGLTISLAEG